MNGELLIKQKVKVI